MVSTDGARTKPVKVAQSANVGNSSDTLCKTYCTHSSRATFRPATPEKDDGEDHDVDRNEAHQNGSPRLERRPRRKAVYVDHEAHDARCTGRLDTRGAHASLLGSRQVLAHVVQKERRERCGRRFVGPHLRAFGRHDLEETKRPPGRSPAAGDSARADGHSRRRGFGGARRGEVQARARFLVAQVGGRDDTYRVAGAADVQRGTVNG